MMEDAAASLGWGRWHSMSAAAATQPRPRSARRREQSVRRRRVARRMRRSATPIAGMLEAIAGALWSRPAVAHETRCARPSAATEPASSSRCRRVRCRTSFPSTSLWIRPDHRLSHHQENPDMKTFIRCATAAGLRGRARRERVGGRPQGRAQRVAVRARTRRSAFPYCEGHAGRGGLQGRRSTAARCSSSCSTTAPTRPTPARNARKLVEEEKVDVLMGSSGVPATHRDLAGRTREQDADDRPVADLAAAGRERLDRHGRAAAAADDRRGGRAHEARRRQDRRLHRLLRCLGRPRLQLADEGGRAGAASRC